jgi:hypothetical protein
MAVAVASRIRAAHRCRLVVVVVPQRLAAMEPLPAGASVALAF